MMYGAITNDESGKTATILIDDKDTTTTTASTTLPQSKNIYYFFLMGAFGILMAALAASASSPPKATVAFLASSTSSIPDPLPKPSLSRRGASVGQVRDDLPLFQKASEDPYHPTDNPQGYLVMLVAENKLMSKEMAHKIEQVQADRPIPSSIFNYGSMVGDLGFKQSMAVMMQHWIDAPVHPDFLQFQDGAGPMLSQIAFVLTDPGDAVLTVAPGYMAFASDFGIYAGAKFYWIDTDAEQGFIPTIEQLEDGYSRAVKAGNPPRIFVICQPQNPTGVIYSKETMTTLIDWALSKNLHVVSDEIYALSTFPGYHTTSAADIMYEKHPNHTNFLGTNVHIVAGLSKDWGMSGFRVGSLFSHNADLLNALGTLGYYSSPSRYTQFLLQGIFDDHEFVTWYIAENRRRLYETYQALEAALSLIQVPLLPSQGAIFAWADFSAYILEGQTEHDLWIELFDKAKVALTSGQSCQSSKPGMFRIVYGWPAGGVTAMEELGHRLVQWKADREASSARIYLAVEHPLDELRS